MSEQSKIELLCPNCPAKVGKLRLLHPNPEKFPLQADNWYVRCGCCGECSAPLCDTPEEALVAYKKRAKEKSVWLERCVKCHHGEFSDHKVCEYYGEPCGCNAPDGHHPCLFEREFLKAMDARAKKEMEDAP